MPQIEFKPLPQAEAVAFFRNKRFVIGFDWRAVVKGTKDGRETFLTSLHRSSQRQLRRLRRQQDQ